MPDTTTPALAVQACLPILEQARQTTLKLAEDFPEDKLATIAGTRGKNLAWILGHLAVSDSFMFQTFGGEGALVPDTYPPLFDMGTEPVDDASKYPTKDELVATLTQCHEKLMRLIESLDEAQLAEPLPERLQAMIPGRAAMIAAIPWHEGIHTGQLIDIRHHLGLPRAFE